MRRLTAVVASMLALTALVVADQPAPPEKLNLPGITVRGDAVKSIAVEGAVALTNGILEFVACEPNTRDYESVLTFNCKPSALQFALLLIGCEPGVTPEQAQPGQKIGDRLDLELEWTANGKPQRAKLEQFLIHRQTGRVATNLAWYYTGSRFVKNMEGREVFLADSEQAFISLWWNPGMLINVGGKFGNPYNSPEEGFAVNGHLIPPIHAPVILLIRKHRPEDPPAADSP